MRDPTNTIIRQTVPKNTLTIEQERNLIISAQYGSTSNNVSDPQFVSNIENVLPSSQNIQVTTTTTTQQQQQRPLLSNCEADKDAMLGHQCMNYMCGQTEIQN